jgi:hypothetical protein
MQHYDSVLHLRLRTRRFSLFEEEALFQSDEAAGFTYYANG